MQTPELYLGPTILFQALLAVGRLWPSDDDEEDKEEEDEEEQNEVLIGATNYDDVDEDDKIGDNITPRF